MEGYEAATYGDRFADVYDDWYADVTDVDACVARLAALAADTGGPVLELGVGTGRLALPLAALGLDVRGVDASDAMLARLRAKAGGADVAVVAADLASFDPPTRPDDPDDGVAFGVVYVAYNTLFNVADRDGQAACLQRAAQVLRPGGIFVVEAFVPPDDDGVDATSGGQDGVAVRTLTADRVVLSVARHDAATQTMSGQFVDITEAGIRLRPWHLRYLTPPQLDALADEVGLELVHRWAGWARQPFDDRARSHVSVYRRAL